MGFVSGTSGDTVLRLDRTRRAASIAGGAVQRAVIACLERVNNPITTAGGLTVATTAIGNVVAISRSTATAAAAIRGARARR
jgi:hypothetical protein